MPSVGVSRSRRVVTVYFPAPHSYTGDDVVEVSAHGSPVGAAGDRRAAIERGARLAEPGEFTLRAFLNGRHRSDAGRSGRRSHRRRDAAAGARRIRSARGHADARDRARSTRALFDLIARLEASVDFPDEGYHFVDPRRGSRRAGSTLRDRTAALLAERRRGRLVREGLQIAIVGTPNVGKSSLFNALVGASARSSRTFPARRAIW